MIEIGESSLDVTFLTGEALIHMTEDYTMLAMRNFWRYLKGIVVTMHLDLYLTVLVAL